MNYYTKVLEEMRRKAKEQHDEFERRDREFKEKERQINAAIAEVMAIASKPWQDLARDIERL